MTLERELVLLENNFLKECFLSYGKCPRHSFIVFYLPSIRKKQQLSKRVIFSCLVLSGWKRQKLCAQMARSANTQYCISFRYFFIS